MGDLSQVRVTFTIDLTPYVAGLKTMMSMTSAVGQQLTPLLQLKAKADTQVLDAQLKALQKSTDSYIDSQVQATQAQDQGAKSTDQLIDLTNKSAVSTDRHSSSMRGLKRPALEMFGAISFLGTSLLSLISSSDNSSSKIAKLSQGMNQGISAGFGLASMMTILGIASGGTAVLVGAVVTIGTALFKMFDDSADRAKRSQAAVDAWSQSIRDATLGQLEAVRGATVATRAQLVAQLKDLDEQANAWTRWGLVGQLAGYIFAHGLEDKRDTIKKVLDDLKGYIDKTNEEIGTKEKTSNQVRDALDRARTDSIIDQFAKQRAEEDSSYKKAEDDWAGHADVLSALKKAHNTKMRDIDRQEADYRRAQQDVEFEGELARMREAGLKKGMTEEQINLAILQTQQAYYQKEADALAKSVNPADIQKRIELETKITQNQEQQTAARVALREQERQIFNQIADLDLQDVLARLKKRESAEHKTSEQIDLDVLDRTRLAYQAELNLLNQKQILNSKELLQKKKLETQLSQLDADRIAVERKAWESTHQLAMVAFQSIGVGARTLFTGLLGTQRQAKNQMDAAWLAIENTAINALGGIIEQAIVNELVTKSMLATSTIAVTAAATTIAAAAAPAAMAVSIMSFGGASWAGAQAFLASLAIMKGGFTAMAFEDGGRLPKGKQGYFEGYHNELVAPEEDFKQIMRAEMIPQIRMDLQRQETSKTINNIVERGNGDGGLVSGELLGEIREMHKTLKNQKLEMTLSMRELKAQLHYQDVYDKRAGRKG